MCLSQWWELSLALTSSRVKRTLRSVLMARLAAGPRPSPTGLHPTNPSSNTPCLLRHVSPRDLGLPKSFIEVDRRPERAKPPCLGGMVWQQEQLMQNALPLPREQHLFHWVPRRKDRGLLLDKTSTHKRRR